MGDVDDLVDVLDAKNGLMFAGMSLGAMELLGEAGIVVRYCDSLGVKGGCWL